MEDRKRLLGYYNYTVVLTYIGMLAGFTGIVMAMEGKCSKTLLCLLVAGVCDMFDGAIASTRERTIQEKRFGIQIDSLSDLICFGLLPALAAYSLSGRSNMGFLLGGFYTLCALIRLAYFNVTEEERQDRESGGRKVYQGLPVTNIALIFPLFYVVQVTWMPGMAWIYLLMIFVVAVAFLLPFEMKKPDWWWKVTAGCLGLAELILLLMGMGMDV